MAERLNIAREVAALKRMTVKELRGRYVEIFGEATRSGNKDWLWKRIAWRMQANAEGGLTERARRRAEELANDADLRTTAPRDPVAAPGGNGARGRAAGNSVSGGDFYLEGGFWAVVAPTPCPGDANGDGVVNITDLGLLLSQFGMSGAGLEGDVNSDGVVNITDLGILLANFGIDCG